MSLGIPAILEIWKILETGEIRDSRDCKDLELAVSAILGIVEVFGDSGHVKHSRFPKESKKS